MLGINKLLTAIYELPYLKVMLDQEFVDLIADWVIDQSDKKVNWVKVEVAHIDKSPQVGPIDHHFVEFGDILFVFNEELKDERKVSWAYVFQVKRTPFERGPSTDRQTALYSGWPAVSISEPKAIKSVCPKTLNLREVNSAKVPKSGFWYMREIAEIGLKYVGPRIRHLDSGKDEPKTDLEGFLTEMVRRKAGRLLKDPKVDDWTSIVRAILDYKERKNDKEKNKFKYRTASRNRSQRVNSAGLVLGKNFAQLFEGNSVQDLVLNIAPTLSAKILKIFRRIFPKNKGLVVVTIDFGSESYD